MTLISRHQLFFKGFYANSDEMRLLVINNPYNFRILDASNPFIKALGYTKEELLNVQSMESLYHPDCYNALNNARDRYLTKGSLNEVELTLKTKNGERLPVLLDISVVKDKEGNIQLCHYLYKNAFDLAIKDDLQVSTIQEELESLNASFLNIQEFYPYFYDFYDHAPDMLASIEISEDLKSTKIISCNRTLARKLGYTKEEIIGKDTTYIYHPDSFLELMKMREHLYLHGYASNWDLQFKKKNGEKIQVSLNAKIKRDKLGRVVNSIGMWRDITDLVETRQRLEETNELLIRQNEEIKTLMHIMSHDIQSPIRAISNYTQFILDGSKSILPASALNFLHKLQVNAKRLHHLTQDVISYFFKGSLESIEKTNLKDIMQQVLSYIDLSPSIKIHFDSNIQYFKTKRTLLAQILYNLISNAIKYHHNLKEAEIHISAAEDNNNLLFIVQDNGPGIPKESHKIVFEPLQRLKSAEVEGSGMGLAIVKKLVTQEGGEITLESELGKGAKFIFTWPKEAC